MLACVPSSTNWLPPLKKLKGLEAPLNRFESPLKNCAWQTPPAKRTATAEKSGTRGLMLALPQVWDCGWIRSGVTFRTELNGPDAEADFARNAKHFRRQGRQRHQQQHPARLRLRRRGRC